MCQGTAPLTAHRLTRSLGHHLSCNPNSPVKRSSSQASEPQGNFNKSSPEISVIESMIYAVVRRND